MSLSGLRRQMPAILVDLLNDFGFAACGFKESDFLESEQLIQLGRAPARIDLLTSISGVTTDEAFATKTPAELDGMPVFASQQRGFDPEQTRCRTAAADIADLDTLA